jgi:hypothetical protein
MAERDEFELSGDWIVSKQLEASINGRQLSFRGLSAKPIGHDSRSLVTGLGIATIKSSPTDDNSATPRALPRFGGQEYALVHQAPLRKCRARLPGAKASQRPRRLTTG